MTSVSLTFPSRCPYPFLYYETVTLKRPYLWNGSFNFTQIQRHELSFMVNKNLWMNWTRSEVVFESYWVNIQTDNGWLPHTHTHIYLIEAENLYFPFVQGVRNSRKTFFSLVHANCRFISRACLFALKDEFKLIFYVKRYINSYRMT